MFFFKDIGSKISSASKDATKKAKDLTEITKLNMQINHEEDSIKKVYEQIGKQYYELFGSSADERFAELCETVKVSMDKIDTNKREIQKIKGIKKCSNCGTEVNGSSKFCSLCGFKINDEEEYIVEEFPQIKCKNCGEPISEDTLFCTNCGSKIE